MDVQRDIENLKDSIQKVDDLEYANEELESDLEDMEELNDFKHEAEDIFEYFQNKLDEICEIEEPSAPELLAIIKEMSDKLENSDIVA